MNPSKDGRRKQRFVQGHIINIYYKCRSCGKQFDSLGDMQRHILVQYMQKGEIPEEKE
jgi:hypothetical protein